MAGEVVTVQAKQAKWQDQLQSAERKPSKKNNDGLITGEEAEATMSTKV